MRIIFLNIWNCSTGEVAKEFIRENALETAIFCFQEAYEKTRWFCKELIPNHRGVFDYKYVSNSDDFPLATYVRNDLDTIETATVIKDLEEAGLGLHVCMKISGKILNICNVHGISRPVDKKDNKSRLMQSQGLIDFYKQKPVITIIGGDFNLENDTKSVLMFEENGYTDLIKKYSIKTTRNKLVWDKYPNNIQYFSDYVFTNKPDLINNFTVPNNEISDHLPMVVDINL